MTEDTYLPYWTSCKFQLTRNKIIEERKGNLTPSEYEELIGLEYVLTMGYSDNLRDSERHKYLSDKK